jgi:release factor glutamine methyltransferase
VPGATNWDLYANLPATLPVEDIVAAYDLTPGHLNSDDTYSWNGWDFELAPGVFSPGSASRLIHDRLLDGRIPVAGRRYAAMGVGLGVEIVVAGLGGAKSLHALDIHEESVRMTLCNYARIVGGGGPRLVGLVSDLWQALPTGVQFDVVTFNAPFVDFPLSSDPAIVRSRCMGTALADRFFDELSSRTIIAPDGVAYLMLSNAEPIQDIVAMALRAGFNVESAHVEHSSDTRLETHLLALR